jgi:uroporphyrinogen-III synthase
LKNLNDAHILVTRPAHQAENLCQLIVNSGGTAVRFPTLEIVAAHDFLSTQTILANLNKFQKVVFISANAVNFALKANGGKIDNLDSSRVAAIGQATAQALKAAHLSTGCVPESGCNTEALLAMAQMQMTSGQHCLIVRGQGGREELADSLRNRGVKVEYWETYKRVIPKIDISAVSSLIYQNKLDVITITSAEALENLLTMLGKEQHQRLFSIALAVVSERIRDCATLMGFKRIAVADNPSDSAILDTVTTLINEE